MHDARVSAWRFCGLAQAKANRDVVSLPGLREDEEVWLYTMDPAARAMRRRLRYGTLCHTSGQRLPPCDQWPLKAPSSWRAPS
jgi:hypothetical protein